MKILERRLRDFTDLPPTGDRAVRDLLDDVGIEVKRVTQTDAGLLYSVELLANRGDHACYQGIARELCGRTGNTVKLPETDALQSGQSPWPLVHRSDKCLLYSLTMMERTGPSGPLPRHLLATIEATGVNTIGAEVDATNLSNLEFGQPTHVFDADTIVGAITIREAAAGETALPLFATERVEVPEGTLVIADEQKILAIAGVIGCQESKTTDATTRLLIESATFDPVSVRKASRALNIHTDSSSRFERGADPSLPLVGAGRIVHLLREHAGWTLKGATGLVGDWTDPERVIAVNIPHAANFLVHPLTGDDATQRLARYGFTAVDQERHQVSFRVPPGRLWDVEHPADLYEELAKSIGYNNTPSTLPSIDMGALPSARELAKRRVEDVLCAAGFYEVFTDGFYARTVRDLLGMHEAHPLWSHVETLNALDRGYSLLKNNGLAQAIDAVAVNHRMKNQHVRCYEFTRTFHPDDGAANGVCTERRLLWAMASEPGTEDAWPARQPSLVWQLKGMVEQLAVELRLPLTVGEADPDDPLNTLLHPGRQAAVLLDGRRVGILGEVHPTIVRNHKLKGARPCYLEIELDPLKIGQRRAYEPPAVHHPSVRSLAFDLPIGVRAGDIATQLRRSGPSWLASVQIVDEYDHQQDGQPRRAITYELTYAHDGAERSADEINAASESLIKAVEVTWGSMGVTLR